MRKLYMIIMALVVLTCSSVVQASETSSSYDIGVYISCPAVQIDEMKPAEKPKDDVSDDVATSDSGHVALYTGLVLASIVGRGFVRCGKRGRDDDVE